jgi:membrane-associated phospholipid phosphatase
MMIRLFRLLMPIEWLLLLCGLLVSGVYHRLGLPMPGQPGAASAEGPAAFFLVQVLTALDLYCLVVILFIAIQVGSFIRHHRGGIGTAPWAVFWKHCSTRLYPEQILQDLRFTVAIVVMFVEFGMLKNLIPHINSSVHDGTFAAVDRAICGGVLCSQALHSVFGTSTSTVETISEHYFWYYPYMSLVGFIFVVGASRELAQEYLFTFVSLFLIGTLVIYLGPTWGPVYFEPSLFDFMKDSQLARLQQSLWRMKLTLDVDPHNREAIFMISGFPSLHIAVVTAGSMYLARISRWLAWGSWVFVALTVNSTLYLGWHYLLDDVGAVVLVLVCILLARKTKWKWIGYVDYAPDGWAAKDEGRPR